MDKSKAGSRIKAMEEKDWASRAYQKLDDIFGLEPKNVEGEGLIEGPNFGKVGINPLKASELFGRGYDSLVGAPTRSALSAAYDGENPAAAAYEQFAEDPATAPDFGLVGNAVADPLLLGGMAGKGAKYLGQMGELGGVIGREAMHVPTNGAAFKEALDAAVKERPMIKDFISDYGADEFDKFQTFLSQDAKSGYAIKPDGDLINVFSQAGGRGDGIVRDAMAQGPKTLDAFDVNNKLPSLYKKYGFNELKREANWTPGGPDVVYMKNGFVDKPQDLDNRALKAALRIKALSANGTLRGRNGE